MRTIRALAVLASFTLGCPSSGPRALVLVDGSSHAEAVAAAARKYEQAHKRSVRVLRADKPDAAILLAARGEAEVALLPESVKIDELVASQQGRDVAVITLSGERLRVVEVSATSHPKVDGPGAHDLAEYLAEQ